MESVVLEEEFKYLALWKGWDGRALLGDFGGFTRKGLRAPRGS